MSAASRRIARGIGFVLAGLFIVAGFGADRTSVAFAVVLMLAGLVLVLALAGLAALFIVASMALAPPQERVSVQATPTVVAKLAATATTRGSSPIADSATVTVLVPAS